MKFLKKHSLIIIGFGIIILYFITRLYNILALPIFTDEAIYVRWAQVAGSDANWRFISLTDGKQPLFIWIIAIFMKFIGDPLLAGRLVSVFSGLLTAIGLYFLTLELFKDKKIALLSTALYVLYPFALVYDRLALYDSLVATFIIWALYFEVLLVRRFRLDLAMILGIIMGLGMLNKTSNNFAMILLPFSLLLFNFKQKNWKKSLRNWIIFAVVSVLIANSMYLVLRLSPFFHIIDQKNGVFVYPFNEWINHPFIFFIGNMRGLLGWFIDYTTIPQVVLIIASFFIKKEFIREKLLLVFWFILPLIALALFGKVLYPRYIFFMAVCLLPLVSFALIHLLQKLRSVYLKIIVCLVFTGMILFKDFIILTDFSKSPIPKADKGQLIEGWPSGVGVSETVKFLEEKAKTQKIYVATEGTFGLMPYSLEIYLHKNSNIKTAGFWPINNMPPKEVLESAKKMPTYFVFYQSCPPCQAIGVAPSTWPLKQIFQIPKLEKGTYYTLYEVLPQ